MSMIRGLWMACAALATATGVLASTAAPLDAGLKHRLEAEARERIGHALAGSPGSAVRFEVRLLAADVRVVSSGPFHRETFRPGLEADRRGRHADARYKARVDLALDVRSSSGELLSSRTLEGFAAHAVRYPAPHAYRTFDSIHALGRTHPGCEYYPDTAHLLRRALSDSLDDDASGVATWIRSVSAR